MRQNRCADRIGKRSGHGLAGWFESAAICGGGRYGLPRRCTGLARHKCASSSYARVRHPRAARPCARRSLTESGMLDVTVQVRYFSSPSFSNGIILRVDAKRDARASMLHPCCAHVQRASTAISVRCYLPTRLRPRATPKPLNGLLHPSARCTRSAHSRTDVLSQPCGGTEPLPRGLSCAGTPFESGARQNGPGGRP